MECNLKIKASFPVHSENTKPDGISVRLWVATHLMAGMLLNPGYTSPNAVRKEAIQQADWLIEECGK